MSGKGRISRWPENPPQAHYPLQKLHQTRLACLRVCAEAAAASRWGKLGQCLNLKWWGALLSAAWHEIRSCRYKASIQKLLINNFAGIPVELVKLLAFVLYSVTPLRCPIAATAF